VCGIQQSEESERGRVKGIQLRYCIVGSERSESVKYCVRDWCQGYEPRVLNIRVQSYLLTVILEITVSALFSLLTALIVLSVVSINAIIC
jgi:hypothetical protein